MSLRSNARYAFGLVFARIMALNDDLTIPANDRIIGGAGPFDFSGVADITTVALTVKLDNAAAVSLEINLTAAVDQAAVTVDELVTALDTAFGAEPLELDASKSTVDNDRLKIETTDTSDPPTWIQLYGECAEIAMIGQGQGQKFIKSDTLTSIGDSPTQKEEETFTTTDAKGLDTEILSDGYRKGFTAAIVDTAEDWELLALIEGGTYDATSGTYNVPNSGDDKIYFFVEAYYARYSQGTNKEADLEGYVKKLYRTCKGSVGDKTHERGFADGNYNITGTEYKDEDGTLYGDTELTELTVAAYTALNLEDV